MAFAARLEPNRLYPNPKPGRLLRHMANRLVTLRLLDFDERLQLAQVVRVAQRMPRARHRVTGLPVIVHDDADDVRQQAAAPGADAGEGRQRRAGDMQPLCLAADAKAGLVHIPGFVWESTGAPAMASRIVSTKPLSLRAQAPLIAATVAADVAPARRRLRETPGASRRRRRSSRRRAPGAR